MFESDWETAVFYRFLTVFHRTIVIFKDMLEDVADVHRTSLEDCPEEGDQVKREDGASVQLSSISWKREWFGCTKVEPRNEKNQVVSLFRVRARSLFAISGRPSGRRPLDLTIVKMKHKSYALLTRVCLTLPRFSFLPPALPLFDLSCSSQPSTNIVSSPSKIQKNRPSSTNFTLNVSSRQSYLQRAGLTRETK